jgi:hypothetical protein
MLVEQRLHAHEADSCCPRFRLIRRAPSVVWNTSFARRLFVFVATTQEVVPVRPARRACFARAAFASAWKKSARPDGLNAEPSASTGTPWIFTLACGG